MLRRTLVLLLALLVASVPVPRASALEQHVLRFSDGIDVTTLNPMFGNSGNVGMLAELTLAHFVRYDSRAVPHPELITELPTPANRGVSRDGLTITYHLIRNARWSDGAPFDSADVVYTFAVISDSRNNFNSVSSWEAVKSVTAPDKYTAVFHLKHPYAAYLGDFFSNYTNAIVLPRHVLAPATDIGRSPYNALPVGIGPFRYTAFRRGDSVEMEPDPNYFRGRPKLKKLVYRILPDENTRFTQLQTGELDLMQSIGGTVAPRARALTGKRNNSSLTNYMSGIFFNTRHAVVSDARVRAALRLATDRATLFDKIVHRTGTLTESVVPQISHDYVAIPTHPYDPAAAAAMLDAAGWRSGADGKRSKNGVPLTIVFALPSAYSPSSATVEILRADWAKIGVGVESHEFSTGQFFGLYSAGGILQTGKFDAALLSQTGNIDADVTPGFGCGSMPPHGFNIMRYCNATVDAALRQYGSTYDSARRAALARIFQERIDRDVPMVVIYERAFVNVFDPHLTGYDPGGFTLMGDPLELDT